MLVKNAAGEAGAGLVNGSVGRVVGFWRPSEVLGTHVSNTTTNAGMGMVRGVKMREDRAGPLVRVEGKENACGAGGVEGEGEGEGKEEEGKKKKRKSVVEEELLPLVEFVMCGAQAGARRREGEHKEAVLVGREEFRVEDAEGKVVARRVQVRFSLLSPSLPFLSPLPLPPLPPSHFPVPIARWLIRPQIPLTLAWAMSIHKAQGQTLPRVKVDLARVFEAGQSYVALSRAAALAGLQVLHFDPRRVRAHPKVLAWSRRVEEEQAVREGKGDGEGSKGEGGEVKAGASG